MPAKGPLWQFTRSDAFSLHRKGSTKQNYLLDLQKSHLGALGLDFCSMGITEYMLFSRICQFQTGIALPFLKGHSGEERQMGGRAGKTICDTGQVPPVATGLEPSSKSQMVGAETWGKLDMTFWHRIRSLLRFLESLLSGHRDWGPQFPSPSSPHPSYKSLLRQRCPITLTLFLTALKACGVRFIGFIVSTSLSSSS